MLSSIFRDEILKWNTNTEENANFVQETEILLNKRIEHKPELVQLEIPSGRAEIFRNEESAGIIEIF